MPTDGISAAGRGTETSVRRRFLGSSRTKHCLTAHCIGTLPVWRLSKIAHFAAIALASCPLLAARPEGADHQWRKNPPGELSIDPVADERLGRVTGGAGAS